MRVWGIDASLRTFKPLFSVPAPGFVNALQLVRPKLTPQPARWRRRGGLAASEGNVVSKDAAEDQPESPAPASDDDEEEDEEAPAAATASTSRKAERSPLLIVALGREPRMGRWHKLGAEAGARNGALVVPLPFRAP